MSNSAIGRSDAPLPKLEKELPVFGAGDLPLAVQAGMWHPIRPRSAMDAQFAFTIKSRFTAPFFNALDDATARLTSAALRYVVPAIDRRLNSRQRRYIRRALRRQIDAEAHRILMTGQP